MYRYVVAGLAALLCSAPSYGMTWEKAVLRSKINDAAARASSQTILQNQPLQLVALAQGRDSNGTRFVGQPSSLKGWGIRWYKVEPLMYHEDQKGHDPANPNFLWYTNAGAPGGRTDRQPLPPDRLQYKETEVTAWRDQWSVMPDAHPADPRYDLHEGLGTMRYKVVLKTPEGIELQSPGIESYQDLGIGTDVWRLTMLADDSYIGHLTGYFNVPGVFGSYPQQVDRYVGADCADFVVGGWNRFRKTKVPYTNVTGLRYEFVRQGRMREIVGNRELTSTQIRQAGQSGQIAISSGGVHLGDVIVFNYNPDPRDRSWDHVGVLYEDRGSQGKPNGQLDVNDLILHAGPAEAQLSALGSERFTAGQSPTRFAVLRWVEK